jgi:hypothetical protein
MNIFERLRLSWQIFLIINQNVIYLKNNMVKFWNKFKKCKHPHQFEDLNSGGKIFTIRNVTNWLRSFHV